MLQCQFPNLVKAQKYKQATPKSNAPINNEPIWKPFPNKPQEEAYHSQADELFYGGAAGGGKTDLILGLAGTAHKQSIIFRRVFPNTRAIIERSREIFARDSTNKTKDSYNESLHIWRLADGRVIEIAAIQYEKDWTNFRGRPHDLYSWDEITEFTENQFRFVNAWNRTTIPNQRCRVVATGNPPTSTEGLWVLDYWGAWLKPDHPNPAKFGELVWYARIGDRDEEVGRGNDKPDPIEYEGRLIYPRSRTFIPAKLEDNPILLKSGYSAVLDALPEPLRSQMRLGIFGLEAEDDNYQVIPSKWVDLAMARWTETTLNPLSAIGCDPARGGKDKTAIALRYGDWIAPIIAVPGRETPDGASVAQLILQHHSNQASIGIDVIGVGSSPVDVLRQMGISCEALNAAQGSTATDRSGKLGFPNLRSEWWWRMREMLDPEQGATLALPPDNELKADLCSARWKLQGWKVQVEPKADIKGRIGRSPDKGESVIYACIAQPNFSGFEAIGQERFSVSGFDGYGY